MHKADKKIWWYLPWSMQTGPGQYTATVSTVNKLPDVQCETNDWDRADEYWEGNIPWCSNLVTNWWIGFPFISEGSLSRLVPLHGIQWVISGRQKIPEVWIGTIKSIWYFVSWDSLHQDCLSIPRLCDTTPGPEGLLMDHKDSNLSSKCYCVELGERTDIFWNGLSVDAEL